MGALKLGFVLSLCLHLVPGYFFLEKISVLQTKALGRRGVPVEVTLFRQINEEGSQSKLAKLTKPSEALNSSGEKRKRTSSIQKAAPDSGTSLKDLFDATDISVTYPRLSRRLGEEGHVLLKIHWQNSLKIDIHQSSGFIRLDRAATQAAQTYFSNYDSFEKQNKGLPFLIELQFRLAP